jgi:hypothetical protein
VEDSSKASKSPSYSPESPSYSPESPSYSPESPKFDVESSSKFIFRVEALNAALREDSHQENTAAVVA